MSAPSLSTPFGRPSASCIEIPYRDEGNGGGAFYDHYAVQRTTGRETVLSIPAGSTMSALESYVKTGTTINLCFGACTDEGKKIPRLVEQSKRVGLLIITGHARESETKRPQALATRDVHERKLLRNALNQGRPVMGVCAGSWQIWSFLGGVLQDVKDHAWKRMPAITTTGKIGYNTQMHKVVVSASSMLSGAIADLTKTPVRGRAALRSEIELTVNSVHWKAPDAKKIPSVQKIRPQLAIVATAKQDDSIAPQCASGEGAFKHPEADTVEAFEQIYGAPILGIQWHPEAYNNDGLISSAQQRGILTYMAKAGDAFCAKREMLASLEAGFQDVVCRFRKISLND